jgi:hypothetical protein
MPSHGKYVGAASTPFAEYKKQLGDRVGHNWRIPSTTGKRAIRHVVYDTNYWKSFIFARLAVALGDKTCLSLFGTQPESHRLLADHLTAEYPITTTGRGRTIEEWKERPIVPITTGSIASWATPSRRQCWEFNRRRARARNTREAKPATDGCHRQSAKCKGVGSHDDGEVGRLRASEELFPLAAIPTAARTGTRPPRLTACSCPKLSCYCRLCC